MTGDDESAGSGIILHSSGKTNKVPPPTIIGVKDEQKAEGSLELQIAGSANDKILGVLDSLDVVVRGNGNSGGGD